MKSKTIKHRLNKKKKNTRRKRGGGENEILNYLLNRPSDKNTREFEKKFSEYIEEIIELQENSKTLSKQKEKDENIKVLNNKKNELIDYIKKLPDNINKKVRVSPVNTERSIWGPPIYIVANLIEHKGQRREILDSLKHKNFAYDEVRLNALIDSVDKSRAEKKEEERKLKEEMKTKIKEEKKKEAENVVIDEVKPKTVFNIIDDIDEGEREKKKAAEHAKKMQRQKEKEWEAEQQKIRDDIKANAERIKREQEKKENIKRETMEKKLKLLQEQQQKNSTHTGQIIPLHVSRIEPTKTERKEQNINIENVANAEENKDYLTALLNDNEMTDVVIKTQELSEDKPIELPEETKEMDKKPIEKPITTTIIKHDPYNIRTIPHYWRTYFPNDELYIFRDYMLSILNDINLLYQITNDYFPSFLIETKNNKYINNLANDPNVNTNIIPYIQKYDTHIRFMLLFIGLMSNILKDKCDIVIKGGKAIQMKCLIPYESNDIDILIVSNKINKREIALEMSKLLIWIVSQQQIIHNMSMIEIDKAEPIIKLSIYTNYGFEALVDIGFNEPKDEIKSYIYSNLLETVTRHLRFNYMINNTPVIITYPIFFISESVEGMIKEKMYYFLKYVALKNYKPEDNVEIFIPKIYKSLKTLFMCTGVTRKNQIIGIINAIIKEKSAYLDGITTKNIKEIADELIKNIQGSQNEM